MLHPLDSPWQKVERARQHLKALQDAVTHFESGPAKPYGARAEMDDQRGEFFFYGVIRAQPPPRISLLVGDFVHNVRSALDHLAYQSRSPYAPVSDEYTQFPIFDKVTQFDPKALSLRHIRTDVRDHMEELQPYHQPETRERWLLRILRDISNLDKHRNIPLVAAYVQLTDLRIKPEITHVELWRGRAHRGIFNDGEVLARVPATPDGEMQFEPRFAFKVALGEKGSGLGVPLADLMGDLYNYARFDLIPSFSRFFPQPGNPFDFR
jgi:hypothetical protein